MQLQWQANGYLPNDSNGMVPEISTFEITAAIRISHR
jgi:hypothetical protein